MPPPRTPPGAPAPWKTASREGASEGTFFPGLHPVVLADRTILGMTGYSLADLPSGIVRPDVAYHRFGPDGTRLGLVMTLPYRAFSLKTDGDVMAAAPALFGPETFLAASGTTIWAAEARGFSLEQRAADGTVFDARGRLLGEVDLPAGLEPSDIGSDYVLGVWKDELDVE